MLKIIKTDSESEDFRTLIAELDKNLSDINGDEQNIYNSHNLIDYIETVAVIYIDENPIGCGAFKVLDNSSVEIKRVYLKLSHRGKGYSKNIMNELEEWALQKGYTRSLLETGKKQFSALALYKSIGYKVIENYGPYKNLSNSICMEKHLLPKM
jgi:GNAT superfamily N-acetyltransferase